MQIMVDNYDLPDKGPVELTLQYTFKITITASEARRWAGRWLAEEVSYLIGTDRPTLVVGERVVWRVPAWIGFPHVGRVGIIGAVDIDVETGEMNNLPACKVALKQNLANLEHRMPPYKPKSLDADSAYLANNVAPTPAVNLVAEEQPEFTASNTEN